MNTDNLDVSKWIAFAQMDYDAAVNMVALHHPVPIEIVCYHCQQSVEKILKAYAAAKSETLIKTHDLSILLHQCSEYLSDFDNYAKPCMTLTAYASLSRYPSNAEITESQMQQALKDTHDVLEFTKQRLAEMGCQGLRR